MSATVGQPAPDFTLPDQDGDAVSLSSLQGRLGRRVLLPEGRHAGLHDRVVLVPRQLRGLHRRRRRGDRHQQRLRRVAQGLRRRSTTCRSRCSPTPTAGVRKAFGVGKTLGLLPGRVTYVIDPEGVVRHKFSSQFKPKSHIDEALDVIKAGSAA